MITRRPPSAPCPLPPAPAPAGLQQSQRRQKLQNLRERLLAAVATGQEVAAIEQMQQQLEHQERAAAWRSRRRP
jgi:hypothetical protein